jgi:hypothetical protein
MPVDHVRCAGDSDTEAPCTAATSKVGLQVQFSDSSRTLPASPHFRVAQAVAVELAPPAARGRGVAESDCGSSESGESGSAGDRSVRVRVGRWGWPLAWMASVAAPGLSSVPVGPAPGPGVSESVRPGPGHGQ